MRNSVISSNSQTYENDVLKSSMPVAVYFYSEDCPHCTVFEPVFKRASEMYGDNMKFVKIFRQHNRELAESLNIKSSPTVLFFRDGVEVCSRLNGYISMKELREAIEGIIGGWCINRQRQKIYCDVLILGGGPAGLSSAIYTGRAKLFTVVLDEGITGGQAATTFHVANYPGTNGVVRGLDLMENMKKQALDFGAIVEDMKKIVNIELDGEQKLVETEDADYYARVLIIATGAEPRKLPAEGEKEFRGRGVHYCAACDGALYQDANLVVVGGGNSAVEEAVFLTRYAKHVTIVHQFDHFQASKIAQEEVFKNPAISIIWNSEVRKINGDGFIRSVTVENLKTGELTEIEADGLFVYIGMQPRTEMFRGKVQLNDQGYIITDEDMRTNIPGVFAAGDVRNKKIRQIATATADGVIAGLMAERYINERAGGH